VIWGDGTQDRDFIHISDVVAGTMAVVDNEVEEPVNLCTGRRINFNDLAYMVCEEVGYQPREFTHILDAPMGVQHRVGDPARMLEFYTPKVSLEEGIRRAVRSAS
jgi:nucleoside-diphosphate-sugar epimerase